MRLTDVCQKLELSGALREQLLTACFGRDAFVGPDTMLDPEQYLLLAFWKSAFALIFFAGHDAWLQFLQETKAALAGSTADLARDEATWPPVLVIEGRLLITGDGRMTPLTQDLDLVQAANLREKNAWSTCLHVVPLHWHNLRKLTDVARHNEASHPPAV